MSNCKGCSKPIQFAYRKQRGHYEEDTTLGTREYVAGPPLLDGDDVPVIEDLCEKCIDESKVNRAEGYYDGLWLDKHGHPSHIVTVKPEDYLI